MTDLAIESKLDSWQMTLLGGWDLKENNWKAPHLLSAGAVYAELLNSMMASREWTRDPVIVAGLLDLAAEHLKNAGMERRDVPTDVLLITDFASR